MEFPERLVAAEAEDGLGRDQHGHCVVVERKRARTSERSCGACPDRTSPLKAADRPLEPASRTGTGSRCTTASPERLRLPQTGIMDESEWRRPRRSTAARRRKHALASPLGMASTVAIDAHINPMPAKKQSRKPTMAVPLFMFSFLSRGESSRLVRNLRIRRAGATSPSIEVRSTRAQAVITPALRARPRARREPRRLNVEGVRSRVARPRAGRRPEADRRARARGAVRGRASEPCREARPRGPGPQQRAGVRASSAALTATSSWKHCGAASIFAPSMPRIAAGRPSRRAHRSSARGPARR